MSFTTETLAFYVTPRPVPVRIPASRIKTIVSIHSKYVSETEGITFNKISAIKAVRDEYNIGLKDAKEIVEFIYTELNPCPF